MAETKRIGDFGEQAVAEYMQMQGMTVIARNYSCRIGELDIIATDGEYTVFTEVKTRKSANYGVPAEFVDAHKRERIIKTALLYLGDDNRAMRFDVAEVYYYLKNGEPIMKNINYIKNAFA